MEVQAHTTAETRKMLRDYLRNRRLTTSLHSRIMAQTLQDLEEALRLLAGLQASGGAWGEEVQAFLGPRVAPPPLPDPAWGLPGLLEGFEGAGSPSGGRGSAPSRR